MRILSKKQVVKPIPSEIDRVVAMADAMTYDEMGKAISERFEKDLQLLKRLVMEQRERHEWARKKPEIQQMLEKVEKFYADLIADGYVKKDLNLLKKRGFEDYKLGQAREEVASLLQELKICDKDYKEAFRKANRAYLINYETLCDSHLAALAQKISGLPIRNKARILYTVSSYRDKKHEELFRSLIPQVRNAISHQNFVIDPKQPKVTFYDRGKTPLTLTIEEHASIFWESFYLALAFDIAEFDLKSGILDIIIEAVDIVDDYAKKHGLKFVRGKEAPLTLLDWAALIKSGRIP